MLSKKLLLMFNRSSRYREVELKARIEVSPIFQLLLGSFCEDPHGWVGPSMMKSLTCNNISSQRPSSIYLALLSTFMTHRHTEI